MNNPSKPSIKPPFKWTGGKNRMWEKYLPHFFPKDIDIFVDMFCGATSISLWIHNNYPDAKIILNDFNPELMSLYGTFQKDYDRLEKEYVSHVEKFLTLSKQDRKAYYYSLREEYCHDHEDKPDYINNSKLYFMLRTNFNGMWKAYKKCNLRYSTPPGTLLQKPKFFDLEGTRKFKEFVDQCTLRSEDFGALADYDASGTQNGCYIAESNKEIGDGFWENEFDDDYNFTYMNAKYTAGRGKTMLEVKEVLVTNFDSDVEISP